MAQSVVFVSYSHHDEKEKEALLSHLGMLQHAGLIDLWSEDRIQGGSDWEQEIQQAMNRASVAILLISANYLNTPFILSRQIPVLLKRRKSEGLIIFPIIAKACAWQKIDWLAQMRVRPASGQPVWRGGGLHADEELATIAAEIAEIIIEQSNTADEIKSDLSPPPFHCTAAVWLLLLLYLLRQRRSSLCRATAPRLTAARRYLLVCAERYENWGQNPTHHPSLYPSPG